VVRRNKANLETSLYTEIPNPSGLRIFLIRRKGHSKIEARNESKECPSKRGHSPFTTFLYNGSKAPSQSR
jgi:hypothetical protein